MIETGIASAGMTVALSDARKRKMMRMTSPAVSRRVSWASLIERWMNTEPSNAMLSVTPGGSVAWIAGSSSWTAFATSITLAFDWRTTPMKTAGVCE